MISIEDSTYSGWIVAGVNDVYDPVLTKFNDSLTNPWLEWQNTYNETGMYWVTSIVRGNNNNNIFIGHGSDDVIIVKVDDNGQIKWQNQFGGEFGDYANSITLGNNSYIVGGNKGVAGALGQFWLTKLDTAGNVLYEYLEDEDVDVDGTAHSVIYIDEFTGTPVVAVGSIGERESSTGIWINVCGRIVVKAHNDLSNILDTTICSDSNDNIEFISVVQSNIDNNIVIAGYEGNKILLLELSLSSNEIIWENEFDFGYLSRPSSISKTHYGGYSIVGSSGWGDGNYSGPVNMIIHFINDLGDSLTSVVQDTFFHNRGTSHFYKPDGKLIVSAVIKENSGDDFKNWILKYDALSFSPILSNIPNQEIEEDTDPFLFVTGTFYGSIDDYTLYAYSDTADFYVIDEPAVFGYGWRFELIPAENWFGEATVTLILAENESGLADTTDFMVTVIPINDSPEPFTLIYPTSYDTLEINTDTDETYTFYWDASEDVDSEVNYTTSITLDYFGDTYSEEYESTDSLVSISGYEWAALMTNLNLSRWTLEYIVQATDGEYTVESEVGEFVFENTSLSTDNELTPLSFRLHQNHPNPFNPVTTLRYDLPEDAVVNITIYDMMGRVVRNLVNSQQNAGYKSIQWNATNRIGQPVSAGLYLYTIQAGEFRQVRKMVLLK